MAKKLTHIHFTGEEWVKGNSDGDYIFEDGVTCSSFDFWYFRSDIGFDNGWSLLLGINDSLRV